MRPCSCSGISFCVSPYSRNKTGLAGSTRDSLPGAVDPWMWPKERTVVRCTWCQGAAWAAGAGPPQHRQRLPFPARCPGAGHCPAEATASATGDGSGPESVGSTVGVRVTQEPAPSRTGDTAVSGTRFPCPGRGVRGWGWQGQPGAQPCRAWGPGPRHRGGREGQGQAAQGTRGTLVHPSGSHQNFCRCQQRGCKQPILQLCSAFIARTHSLEQSVSTCYFLQVFIQIVIGF